MITPVAFYNTGEAIPFSIDNIVGGTTASFEGDIIIAFTQSGSFTIDSSGTASILSVAGGAGGNTYLEPTAGAAAGGGGGGGVSYFSSKSLDSGRYEVTIGDGGVGGLQYIPPWSYIGGPGGNTEVKNLTTNTSVVFNIGAPSPPAPAVTITDGRQGGNSGFGNTAPAPGYRISATWSNPYGAGGSSTFQSGFSDGTGGNGYFTSIRGIVNERFGGGGGGGAYSASGGVEGALGGLGGGGNGGYVVSISPAVLVAPTPGENGRGGGGGGGSLTPDGTFTEGADGGSGIVVIRYTPG